MVRHNATRWQSRDRRERSDSVPNAQDIQTYGGGSENGPKVSWRPQRKGLSSGNGERINGFSSIVLWLP